MLAAKSMPNAPPATRRPEKKNEAAEPRVEAIALTAEDFPVKKSSELLMDPDKGALFLDYYTRIREKIHDIVERRFRARNVGGGTVELLFVLRSDGTLEHASVSDDSEAAGTVRSFAIGCLKEAAPFGSFPRELGVSRIAFNLTVLFETK